MWKQFLRIKFYLLKLNVEVISTSFLTPARNPQKYDVDTIPRKDTDVNTPDENKNEQLF